MSRLAPLFTSCSPNWATDPDLYAALDREFTFDFDPCPLNDAGVWDGKAATMWFGQCPARAVTARAHHRQTTQREECMMTTLVATDRPSLDRAHGDVAQWVRERLDRVTVELQEARAALSSARERKWSTAALARVVRRHEQHEQFLVKVNAALAAGFAIVPNFQITRLAVRTDKMPPRATTYLENEPQVGALRLPIGQGRYVNPEPEFTSFQKERTRKDSQGKEAKYTVTLYETAEHAPVDVPLTLMKAELADALHEAMEARLFDEIGIVYDGPKRDPVLVGRLLHPKGSADRWGSMSKGVTFFIAWWFQPSSLDL